MLNSVVVFPCLAICSVVVSAGMQARKYPYIDQLQQAALRGPTGTTRLDAEGQDTCCGVRVKEAAGGPPGESVPRLPA